MQGVRPCGPLTSQVVVLDVKPCSPAVLPVLRCCCADECKEDVAEDCHLESVGSVRDHNLQSDTHHRRTPAACCCTWGVLLAAYAPCCRCSKVLRRPDRGRAHGPPHLEVLRAEIPSS